MAGPRLTLCLGVHNHQPVGNFDAVLRDATERAYHPLLARLHARPEVRVTLHWTGSLLEWLRDEASPTFDLLGTLTARGQVEVLTGGFYEPILAVLPDRDKVGQIERLSEFLRRHFGVRPRGMWLAERVWEPELPRALRAAGVEYVLLDDTHFALAGLAPERLDGYYLTEDQGDVVGVFPISQRLRYLIPFADVQASVDYLAERAAAGARVITVADDGEKFGVWPGTHELVYTRGWLDAFFDRLLDTPGLVLGTLGDVAAATPARGRVYLPAASYREMGEWALPVDAARELDDARRALGDSPHAVLLRGGIWRGFLVKYPEVADTYWKMLRVSEAVAAAAVAAGGDGRVERARTALWRGQANDAYWHGVFGGCYLPHLRRAVRGALLEAERLLAEACGGNPVTVVQADLNGDGREEIAVRTEQLAVTVAPALGGAVTEIGLLHHGLDLADVLTRRREAYHRPDGDAGDYDELRRACLLDGLFRAGETLEPVAPWPAARAVLAQHALDGRAETAAGGVRVSMTGALDGGVEVDKDVVVRGATVEAQYRLRGARAGRWAVQWNLALSAGAAPGRYLDLPERPSLGSRGRRADLDGVTLVDEWTGLEARLTWTPRAELGWAPVETLSLSEGGTERLYQGLAVLLVWPCDGPDESRYTTTLTVVPR